METSNCRGGEAIGYFLCVTRCDGIGKETNEEKSISWLLIPA